MKEHITSALENIEIALDMMHDPKTGGRKEEIPIWTYNTTFTTCEAIKRILSDLSQ